MELRKLNTYCFCFTTENGFSALFQETDIFNYLKNLAWRASKRIQYKKVKDTFVGEELYYLTKG